MNIDELRALIVLTDQAQLSLLQWQRPGYRLRLEGTPGAAPAVVPGAATAVSDGSIEAPGFGLFCTHHPTRAAPLCADAAQVRAGDVLALIRVDQFYLPVVSTYDGVAQRLVDDGVLVGYGTPLFNIVR